MCRHYIHISCECSDGTLAMATYEIPKNAAPQILEEGPLRWLYVTSGQFAPADNAVHFSKEEVRDPEVLFGLADACFRRASGQRPEDDASIRFYAFGTFKAQ